MSNYNCYCLLPNGKPVFDKNGKPDLKRGDLYISVSNVLSMESSGDFLITWALGKFGPQPDPTAAYRQYMEEVSDLGSRLHHFVECDMKGIKYSGEWADDMEPGAESYIDFKKRHKIKLIDSEKILFSKAMRVAGTRDLKVEIDDQLYIADLKTGSVMPKAFVQLAAYSQMGHEMGEKDNEQAELLVLGGADSKSKIADGGEFKMHTIKSMFGPDVAQADLFAQFQCLRYLWFMKNIKSRKFEPIIKGMAEALDPMIERFKKQFHNM